MRQSSSNTKKYRDAEVYEKKLDRVMERFEVEEYDYDWSRKECWVNFKRNGKWRRFEYSVEKAKRIDKAIQYGSDAFAILVLRLEDLARVVESGVYDIDQAIAGLKELPEPTNVPECFQTLGFDEIPNENELLSRYRKLLKQFHPDHGGMSEQFQMIRRAYEEATEYNLQSKK